VLRNRIGLHQKYMADYEYRMMIGNYERLCGEVTVRKETSEERKEKREPYRYDWDKAVARIIDRTKKGD